jgi:hypothetical protein
MLPDNFRITITDEFMRKMISATRQYCIVVLKAGPRRNEEGVETIIWEHGRRNFALRTAGVLSIVCPISDGSNVAGVGIFNATVEEVKKIMDEDPAVQAGVLIYETHACRSFPGDSLPKEKKNG